ncbi:hypothetical protein SAMN04489732_113173 [Amycolatopsis saalfeldensis]|uniref:Uncharacterized protein n=1 Tax=Amycolatopsis saalfeldensis TaxID=394193 RepID=A0A1H8YC36_9PSEU|nr:hypothetical protein SAMN04489732_113173 [Amycolatopsis saalfeldensis]
MSGFGWLGLVRRVASAVQEVGVSGSGLVKWLALVGPRCGVKGSCRAESSGVVAAGWVGPRE